MRQDYRRFFLGEGDKVQEPTLFSIYNLRIIWAWLNLATFVVFGLRFVMRLLTARHVDPQMYPKGAFSYLACHWSAWLEMLVILPGIFFSFLQSQHTRRDLEARHLIHGTKEVIPGYFLLFFVDLADCYLILRGNSPKLLLQVYLTISRPYGYALLLLVGAWVTVAGGYWITAIGQEMAPSIGSKYSDSNLQPDKDAANFHQTKFQSMADAMYHVFVNFNGEYPLGADHLTFWSRFWALTSVFVGVLLLTIPVGIFSKALQKVIEEGQKEQAGASSLDDQEDPGVLPNGAAGGRVIDENGRMIDEQRRGRGEGDGDNDDFNTCMRFRRPQAFSDASTIVPGGPPPREPGAPSQEASGPSLAPTQSPDASLSVNGVSASVLSGQAGGLHPDVAGSPLSAGTLPSTVGDTNISVAVAPGGLVNSSMAQTASTDMPEGARAVTALYEDLLITEEEERVSPREGDLQDETALRLLPRIVEGRRMFRDDRNVPEHTGEQPTIVGEKMETVLEQTERLCAMEEERILLQQDYSNNDLNLMESFEEQGEFPEMATLRPFRFGCCQRVGSVVVRKWFIHVAALLGVASIVNYIIFDHFQGEALYVYAEDAARAQRKCKFWNWNWLCGKVERSHRYSRWSRGEQVSALHGDHLALFNTLLAIEGACTLFFLCEYILRIIDNNWHDRLLACRVARRLELPTPRYEVETQCHYLFTSWGLIDLLSWLPSTVMLSLFLVESAQGHTCGGAAGERTGCVDLTKDWIWYFYGLCCVRALKWERVIYAFASIRKILNDYLLLYEYFLVLSFSLMAMFSVIIHVTEANNPDADQRFQVMSYPRALWMVVLTLNGESPWADYTYMGRVLHVLMMLLAVPIFAVPCGLFANAFHRYLGQVEDTPDEDDGYPSAFESSSGSFKNLDEVAGVEKDLRNGASDDRDGAQDSGAANLDERSGYNNKSVAFRAAEATRSRAQMRSMRQHSNATSAMIGQSATNLGVGPGKERKTRDLDEPLDYEEYLGDETKKANRQLSKAPADGLKSLQRAFNRFGSRSRVVRQSGTSNWNPDAPVPGGSRSRSKPAAFSSMQVSRNPRNNDDDDAALVPQFLHAESAPASAGHSKSKVFDPSGDQEAKDDTLAPLLGARGESTAAGPRTFDEVFGIDEDDLAARARRKSIAASRGVRIAESATITTYEKSGIDSGVTESPEFVPNRLTAGTFEPGEDVIAAATSGGLKLSSRRSSVDVTAEELAGDWEGIFPGEAKRRNSTPTPRETAYSYNLPDTGTTTAEVAMSKKSNLITGLKRRMEEEEQRRAKIYPPASKTFRRLHRIIWCPDHVLLTRKSEHCWATLRRFFTLLALPFLFFNSIYYSMHHCCAVWHYGRLENWSEYVSTFRLNERTRIEMLSYHNHLRHVIELISVRRLSPDTAGGAKWQMQQRAEIQLASVRAAASNSNANVYESDHDQAPAPSPSGASPSLLSQLSFSSASGGSTGASGPQPQAPRLFRSYPAALETNVKPPDMLFFQRFLVQNYVGSDDALIHCEGKDDGDVELDDTEFPSGEIDLDHARLTIPTFLPLYLGSDPEIDRTLLEKGKYLDYLDAVETRAQKLCKDIGAEYKPNDVESRAITELQARYLIIERKPGWADNDRGVPWSERQQYLGGRLVSRWQALAEYDEYLAGYESFGGIGERVRTQSWYDWVRQTLFGRNMQWFPTYLVAIDVFTFVVFLIDYILILLSTSKRMWYLTSVAGVCHLLGLVGLLGTLIVRAAAPAAFFNVYADLVYKTRGGFASYFMLASLSCRMFMVGYLDNLYPSIRMVADCVWRYKREMIQSVYIVIVVWLFASATFHLTEKENFGTQKDSGKTSTWRSIDDQGEDNELRRNLKPVNYSRYYTLLNTFQLVMIHLTGDYPITEYTNVGRVCHVLLMAAAAGFLAVPTGLFVAVYAQQLKLTRAATMHLARRFAAVRLQRQWRGVLARRKFRRLIQTARRNRDIVMEVRPSCFEKFAEWCLSLVSPRPWQVTRCGYYYQWIMIGLHLFASILGIVLSTRPLQWVTVPDEDAARISDTSFTRTAVALWYVILGAQILFFVEYLLRLVAARAMPQMNFSMWRMFTKSASLLDLTLFCVYIVANVVIYLDVKDYTNDPDAFEQGGRQPLLKPTINEAGSDRGKPEVPISNWMEAVIWERTGNFVLVLHVWRVLHGMFFADWSLHVSGYLATQQLMANAGILALFIFLIGGTMWWLCERHYQNEFDSLWSAIYGGSIFLLSEWFVCDFQVAGKILCIFYCVAGVGMFGIATGAIYDGLGEGLSQFVEYRRHVKWSMLKEEYHARELEAREHARQILDGSEAYHAGEQRARVTHLLLSTSEEEQQPTRKH
ncbi:unnamed protein product [Amoebophrya sp. A25]|nr:unnamed protein product [Amoebophrya sp. A25]|eukprot:GSA25T00005408001.1